MDNGNLYMIIAEPDYGNNIYTQVYVGEWNASDACERMAKTRQWHDIRLHEAYINTSGRIVAGSLLDEWIKKPGVA